MAWLISWRILLPVSSNQDWIAFATYESTQTLFAGSYLLHFLAEVLLSCKIGNSSKESSAKSLTVDNTSFVRLLMKIKKESGQRMELCDATVLAGCLTIYQDSLKSVAWETFNEIQKQLRNPTSIDLSLYRIFDARLCQKP